LDLVDNVVQREACKQEAAQQSRMVWEKRVAVADMKRRFLSLGAREDEELLHGKGRAEEAEEQQPCKVHMCLFGAASPC
jgi:enhancer of polycomb-like protein